jgi:hypothetical protein
MQVLPLLRMTLKAEVLAHQDLSMRDPVEFVNIGTVEQNRERDAQRH